MFAWVRDSSVIIVIWSGSNYIGGVASCFFRRVFIYSSIGPRTKSQNTGAQKLSKAP